MLISPCGSAADVAVARIYRIGQRSYSMEQVELVEATVQAQNACDGTPIGTAAARRREDQKRRHRKLRQCFTALREPLLKSLQVEKKLCERHTFRWRGADETKGLLLIHRARSPRPGTVRRRRLHWEGDEPGARSFVRKRVTLDKNGKKGLSSGRSMCKGFDFGEFRFRDQWKTCFEAIWDMGADADGHLAEDDGRGDRRTQMNKALAANVGSRHATRAAVRDGLLVRTARM